VNLGKLVDNKVIGILYPLFKFGVCYLSSAYINPVPVFGPNTHSPHRPIRAAQRFSDFGVTFHVHGEVAVCCGDHKHFLGHFEHSQVRSERMLFHCFGLSEAGLIQTFAVHRREVTRVLNHQNQETEEQTKHRRPSNSRHHFMFRGHLSHRYAHTGNTHRELITRIWALAEGLRQPTSRECHGGATGRSDVAPAEETVRCPNVSRGTGVATSGRHRPRELFALVSQNVV